MAIGGEVGIMVGGFWEVIEYSELHVGETGNDLIFQAWNLDLFGG